MLYFHASTVSMRETRNLQREQDWEQSRTRSRSGGCTGYVCTMTMLICQRSVRPSLGGRWSDQPVGDTGNFDMMYNAEEMKGRDREIHHTRLMTRPKQRRRRQSKTYRARIERTHAKHAPRPMPRALPLSK